MTEHKDVYEEKRKKALEYLGEKWVLHANYKLDDRHSLRTVSTGRFNSYGSTTPCAYS